MKRILYFVLCLLLAPIFIPANAQTEEDRLSDADRIALTAVVLDDVIPAGARKQLVNKMSQIAAKNGCAATGNSRFIITCSADILTQDITPTAPPMHAYTLALNFFVGDGVEGRLFSSTTVEAKGVGQTPEKAYINALKNVRVNDPAFKALLDKGKKEIIAYYNSQCDFILAEAKAKVSRQEYTAALEQLTAIPPVCEECYQKALDASVEAYQAWRDQVCQMALAKAQSAWAQRDTKAAAEALEAVPADGACVEEAKALRQEIAAKMDAKERQEWEAKMQEQATKAQQDQDQSQQVKEVSTAKAATAAPAKPKKEKIREAAIQALKEETPKVIAEDVKPAPKPTYEVKGKWFK